LTHQIHPTAIVDPSAEIGPDVVVDAYAIVGPTVTIHDGTTVGARAIIERGTRIGSGCTIGAGSILGTEPQDRKYTGELTRVEVGDHTVLREMVTVNRGVKGPTVIGAGCYIMTYAHIAHDCVLGQHVTVGNAVQCAGHVVMEDHANVGGLTPIHQFVRIGKRAFIGGGSRVPMDVPPFALAAGNPIRLYGINVEGLRRAGFTSDQRRALKRAFRLLFNSDRLRSAALDAVRQEFPDDADVIHLADFVASSQRGVLV
jgi:UDP-N-acetylglucosamine acyltransferase